MSTPHFQLNPATRILLWLGFAVAVQGFGLALLGLSTLLAGLGLWASKVSAALNMLRRSRWLLLSLLLIYAFATPGDPVIANLGAFGPTYQGLSEGATQAWRLSLLLATLALLLHACPREELLSGIYILSKPFRFAGLDPERIAVRLWLTLRYAERERPANAPRRTFQGWWQELLSVHEGVSETSSHVSLELPPFTLRDAGALAAATLLLGLVLW